MINQGAILSEEQIAVMDASLTAIQAQLSDAQRAYEDIMRRRIAGRVAELPDGFWLVQARQVLGQMREEPAWHNSYLGTDLWNICNHLDNIIREMDQRSRQGGKA